MNNDFDPALWLSPREPHTPNPTITPLPNHRGSEPVWAGGRKGWAPMVCDCCGKRLGWGAHSFEGADLYCDECADVCFKDYVPTPSEPDLLIRLLGSPPPLGAGTVLSWRTLDVLGSSPAAKQGETDAGFSVTVPVEPPADD